jgi:hypothetical protein
MDTVKAGRMKSYFTTDPSSVAALRRVDAHGWTWITRREDAKANEIIRELRELTRIF